MKGMEVTDLLAFGKYGWQLLCQWSKHLWALFFLYRYENNFQFLKTPFSTSKYISGTW